MQGGTCKDKSSGGVGITAFGVVRADGLPKEDARTGLGSISSSSRGKELGCGTLGRGGSTQRAQSYEQKELQPDGMYGKGVQRSVTTKWEVTQDGAFGTSELRDCH